MGIRSLLIRLIRFDDVGKKRIVTSLETGAETDKQPAGSGAAKKTVKKHVFKGTIHILSSYNNTIVTVTDPDGNVLAYSSAGAIGFKGARKSTPYAATLVGKDAVEKAKRFGLQEAKDFGKRYRPGPRSGNKRNCKHRSEYNGDHRCHADAA